MEKTVKVGFTENTKAVTVDVKVEYSGEEVPTNEEIRKESEQLYEEASKFSARKTMQKK